MNIERSLNNDALIIIVRCPCAAMASRPPLLLRDLPRGLMWPNPSSSQEHVLEVARRGIQVV
jgi:hypothetical protein